MLDDKTAGEIDKRLLKIEGQVRGLRKMIGDRRYCVDVLDQIAAVQAALAGLGKLVLRNHIETCVIEAMASGSASERKKKTDEMVAIYGRFCRAS